MVGGCTNHLHVVIYFAHTPFIIQLLLIPVASVFIGLQEYMSQSLWQELQWWKVVMVWMGKVSHNHNFAKSVTKCTVPHTPNHCVYQGMIVWQRMFWASHWQNIRMSVDYRMRKLHIQQLTKITWLPNLILINDLDFTAQNATNYLTQLFLIADLPWQGGARGRYSRW